MRIKYFTNEPGGERSGLTFFCPACQRRHQVNLSWQFNGDLEKPTLVHSVLIRGGHYLRQPPQPGNCYCDFHERHPDEEPMPWSCFQCHSYVHEGLITYLPDCTHAMVGQTVPLPDLEDVVCKPSIRDT